MSWKMRAAWVVRTGRQLGKGQGRKPAADKGEHTRALLSQVRPLSPPRWSARPSLNTHLCPWMTPRSGAGSVQGD